MRGTVVQYWQGFFKPPGTGCTEVDRSTEHSCTPRRIAIASCQTTSHHTAWQHATPHHATPRRIAITRCQTTSTSHHTTPHIYEAEQPWKWKNHLIGSPHCSFGVTVPKFLECLEDKLLRPKPIGSEQKALHPGEQQVFSSNNFFFWFFACACSLGFFCKRSDPIILTKYRLISKCLSKQHV